MAEYEKTEAEWDKLKPNRASTAWTCLSALQQSKAYLGIIHCGYGTSAGDHELRIALTDLEAFQAIRLRKPICIYVIASTERDPSTEAYLTILQNAIPECFRGVGDEREVLGWIKRDLIELQRRKGLPKGSRLGRFLDRSSRLRWKRFVSSSSLLMVPTEYATESDLTVNEGAELIHRLTGIPRLDRAQQEAHLSALLPRMASISWQTADAVNGQRVWDVFCDRWRAATIWLDHHDFGQLGVYSATNTQFRIHCFQAMGDECKKIEMLRFLETAKTYGSREWIRVYGMGGSFASAYYSLGKKLPQGEHRTFLLDQAARWIAVARHMIKQMDDPESLASGLAAILGHIYLASNNVKEAESEFRLSLELRKASGADGGSIAEAGGDLGYILAVQTRSDEGLRLLRESAMSMCASVREGFASRIKLKLAEVYLRRLRVADAIREVREADAICRHHGITLREPATRSASIALRALRIVAARRPVTVEVTPRGYEFHQ